MTLTAAPNQISIAHPIQPSGVRTRLVVYANPEKPAVGPLLAELAAWARMRGLLLSVGYRSGGAVDVPSLLAPIATGAGAPPDFIETFSLDDAGDQPFREGERSLLLTLGGDGTMLHAIHRFWPLAAPVLGVNLGSLGFNASLLPTQMTEGLERWLAGEATVEERLLLRVRLQRAGETILDTVAVNDVVLAKQVEAHVIHLTLMQAGETVVSYPGDGLILSTPMGSTAYNLSAGGPIVHPSLRVIVATAICPHTLAARPVVLAPEPSLQMQAVLRHTTDRVLLWIDGQKPAPLVQGDKIVIEASPTPLRLVAAQGYEYFSQLRRKLLWNVENKPLEVDKNAAG